MTFDIYAREIHEITFSARIVEGVDDDGEYFPEAVQVEGVSFLTVSAIVDIAQEAVNSYFGSYTHGYVVVRPSNWSNLSDIERADYRVSVRKVG